MQFALQNSKDACLHCVKLKRVTARGAAPTSDKIFDFSRSGADALAGPASSDLRDNSEGIGNDGSGENLICFFTIFSTPFSDLGVVSTE